jgi:DNA-directed RNA polymerase subunit F
MVHLTIALEDDVLENAQRKAREQGTSLNDVVRHYIEAYVSGEPAKQRRAVESLLDLSSRVTSGSGGRKWTREDLYDG